MSFISKVLDYCSVVAKVLTQQEMADKRRAQNESVLRTRLKDSPAVKEEKKERPSFLRQVKNPQDAKKFQKELDEQAKESKKKAKKPSKSSKMKHIIAPKKEYKGSNFNIDSDSEIGKDLAKEIATAFKKYHIYVDFSDAYINLARSDGIHAEFYGSMGEDYCHLSGTYTMDGEDKDLEYSLPEDLNEFVADVTDILQVGVAS